MSDAVVSLPAFASELLEHVIVGEKPLPRGFAGLSPAEIDCFNYYQTHRIQDRTLARSQLHQDLWVAFLLDCWNPHSPFHRNGFFVEFGALDGVTLSNTYLFEKQFGWRGILVEPAPELLAQCLKRRACITDSRCVWRSSGETVAFNQVPGNEELATIDECGSSDFHAATRESNKQIIQVPTVSLTDLLVGWKAPEIIDYLSIDTEGSEYEILKVFDFTRYAFRTLSVEHNFTPQREQIRELLASHGYERVPLSFERFDDMYARLDLLPLRTA